VYKNKINIINATFIQTMVLSYITSKSEIFVFTALYPLNFTMTSLVMLTRQSSQINFFYSVLPNDIIKD